MGSFQGHHHLKLLERFKHFLYIFLDVVLFKEVLECCLCINFDG